MTSLAAAATVLRDPREAATRRARAALVAVVSGVCVLCFLTWVIVYEPGSRPWILNRGYPPVPFDLLARYWEVDAARTGTNIYLHFGSEAFSYPPGAIILFLPISYMSLLKSFMFWTQLSVWCLVATYLVALRAVRKGPWLEHIAVAVWACVLTVVLFPPMDSMLSWGQTSTMLLLLMALDLLVVRDRAQGVLVGVATAFKLFPGVMIFFWLWRKQWRPAITAGLTFVLVTAVAWGAWPQSSPWYYLKVVVGGIGGVDVRTGPRDNAWNASVTGLFLRLPLLPHSAGVALGGLASLAVAVLGVWVATRLAKKGLWVTTLVILVCTSVLLSPLAWDHYFTFAPLLVLVVMEVGFSTAAGKVAAVSLGCFTFPWVAFNVAHPDSNLGGGNPLFLAALLVMASGFLASRVSPGVDTQRVTSDSRAVSVL